MMYRRQGASPWWLGTALAALFASACAGAVADGDDGDGDDRGMAADDDEPLPPPSPDSLNRVPDQPLVCDDPKGLNVGKTPLVRLTNVEYHNTIRDLLAPLTVSKRPELPLEVSVDGYSNNWEGQSPDDRLIEQVELGAQDLGRLVGGNLDELGIDGCPGDDAGAEDACFDAFLSRFAMRAYRRPLDEGEQERLRTFFGAQRTAHGFARALQMTVELLLQSPQFLYKLEFGGEERDGAARLTGYEMAARLSYLLWDSMPDDELFEAARNGELESAAGIESAVERMLADPRAGDAVIEFASQWMDLPRLAGNASANRKRDDLFAAYTDVVGQAVLDGLKLFVADAFLGEEGGLRKMFTSRRAFINDDSAFIYDVDKPGSRELVPVELDPERRKGLLTQAGLLAGLAHDADQSAVLRGVFVLDRVLCQPPPPPPPDVSTEIQPADPDAPKTNRQRLVEEHEAQPACRTCHEFIDGAGFAFEHYNAIGRWQDEEFGLPIDSSARISATFDADGEFAGAIDLSERVAGSQQMAQCFVGQWFQYALSRTVETEDGCHIGAMTDVVVDQDGDFRALVKALTKTGAFRYRTALSREENGQ